MAGCTLLHPPCTFDGIGIYIPFLFMPTLSAVQGHTTRAGCILYFHGLLIYNTKSLLCQIQQNIQQWIPVSRYGLAGTVRSHTVHHSASLTSVSWYTIENLAKYIITSCTWHTVRIGNIEIKWPHYHHNTNIPFLQQRVNLIPPVLAASYTLNNKKLAPLMLKVFLYLGGQPCYAILHFNPSHIAGNYQLP